MKRSPLTWILVLGVIVMIAGLVLMGMSLWQLFSH